VCELAIESSPGEREPRYTNFRFSSEVDGRPVLDRYDQVWCFGFAPGNDGSSDDDNIWNSAYRSTTDDLETLTRWMNGGGGVLAMGDHHYLGAAMCAEIPRVRSMRRWTNAQSVPPRLPAARHDTNRASGSSQDPRQTNNPDVIPDGAQRDGVPQPIQWKRYVSRTWGRRPTLRRASRPHPLLCGGDLGVIDVFPDHPHEGWVFEDDEVDLTATYTFESTGAEYPTRGRSAATGGHCLGYDAARSALEPR